MRAHTHAHTHKSKKIVPEIHMTVSETKTRLQWVISLLSFYDICAFTCATMLHSDVKKGETHRCWIPSTVSSLSCRSSGIRPSASSNKLLSNSTHAGISPLDLHRNIHTCACRKMWTRQHHPNYPFKGNMKGHLRCIPNALYKAEYLTGNNAGKDLILSIMI